jgi:hypothetical protein
MENYKLEKEIWNEKDFTEMGWHDSRIHGFAIEKNYDEFTADLVFDIDYIFNWVHPVDPEKYFSFWIAPCTLIFKETFNLSMNIETGMTEFEFEISDLHLKTKSETEDGNIYDWDLELQQGNITFKSKGFEQIVRQKPIHVKEQVIEMEKRGGISFSRDTSCP